MKNLFPVLLICLASSAAAQPENNSIWPISTPEEVGVSSSDLNGMFEYVRKHKTRVHSVQILRHGKLIMDAYFYPFTPNSRHDVASVTKSITSTLTGIAIDQKYITDIKANAFRYFQNYKVEDKLKEKITLEDLITMRSGFDCGTDLSDPKINVDQRLIEIRRCEDWIKCILELPMATDPGVRFAYCNANCHVLSAIISISTKMTLSEFANKQLFKPLGISDPYWPSDPKGINYGWSDLQLYPYDMLKIGQLMLHHGKWNDKQIVSMNWLQAATKEHVLHTGGKDHYGYFWWVPGGDYPDVFEAVGRGGQRITVWPSKDMVIVFTGGGFDTSELVPYIVNAIKSDDRIENNQEGYKQFQENIKDIARLTTLPSRKDLPGAALSVSGKIYKLSSNGLNLTSLQLNFDKSDEAIMNLVWAGENVKCIIGLDGKERFSNNPLIKLSQACIGEWVNESTLIVKIDLVGGINFYTIKIDFSKSKKSVDIALSEGTGLNNEKITGEIIP